MTFSTAHRAQAGVHPIFYLHILIVMRVYGRQRFDHSLLDINSTRDAVLFIIKSGASPTGVIVTTNMLSTL